MPILFLFSHLKTLTSASRADAIRMLCATTRRDRSPVSAGRAFTVMDSPALQVCDVFRNVLCGGSVLLTKALELRLNELTSQ